MRTHELATLGSLAIAAMMLQGCCCCCQGSKPLSADERAALEEERERAAEEAEASRALREERAKLHWEAVQTLHRVVDPAAVPVATPCPDEAIRAVGEDEVGRRTVWSVDYEALPGVSGGLPPWPWLDSGDYESLRKLDASPDDFWADDWRQDIGAPENQHLLVFLGRDRVDPSSPEGGRFGGAVVVVDLAAGAAVCQAPVAVDAVAGETLEDFQARLEQATNDALEGVSGELRVELTGDAW